jgi:hypothetical protein
MENMNKISLSPAQFGVTFSTTSTVLLQATTAGRMVSSQATAEMIAAGDPDAQFMGGTPTISGMIAMCG